MKAIARKNDTDAIRKKCIEASGSDSLWTLNRIDEAHGWQGGPTDENGFSTLHLLIRRAAQFFE
jgi:hypothetical protein